MAVKEISQTGVGTSYTESSCTDVSDDERPAFSGRSPAVLFADAHVSLRPELALYAPFGVALAAFRSALWLLGIALDQPWFRNQAVVEAYLRLLGVTVTWKGVEHIPAGRHILVSNHVSVGDLMMLFSHPTLPRRYTHLITSSLPARVTQCKHLPVVLRHASPAVYDELAASSDPGPVHLFPEGGMTNGAGLLRFSRGFTRIMQRQSTQQQQPQQSAPQQPQQQPQAQARAEPQPEQHARGSSAPEAAQPQQQHHHNMRQHEQAGAAAPGASAQAGAEAATSGGNGTGSGGAAPAPPPAPPGALPVVPVALRVTGMPGVWSHTLTSSFLANLFWFSFSPATTMEATVLPPMAPLPGEARGAFVNRVQAAIAGELGVEVFDMTIQQKKQLAQQRAARRR